MSYFFVGAYLEVKANKQKVTRNVMKVNFGDSSCPFNTTEDIRYIPNCLCNLDEDEIIGDILIECDNVKEDSIIFISNCDEDDTKYTFNSYHKYDVTELSGDSPDVMMHTFQIKFKDAIEYLDKHVDVISTEIKFGIFTYRVFKDELA